MSSVKFLHLADGGLWTGPKVAAWMSQLLGKKVFPQREWEYLKSLEYVRRRPRPAHVESDELEQPSDYDL